MYETKGNQTNSQRHAFFIAVNKEGKKQSEVDRIVSQKKGPHSWGGAKNKYKAFNKSRKKFTML